MVRYCSRGNQTRNPYALWPCSLWFRMSCLSPEEIMQLFCPNCGIKNTKQNYEKRRLEVSGAGAIRDVYFLPCDTCGFTVDIVVQLEPKLNEEEVEKAFQDTPLTDSQKGTKKRFSSVKSKTDTLSLATKPKIGSL